MLVQKEASKWAPHLQFLPRAIDSVLFWEAEELEWLRGTNVMGLANQLQAQVGPGGSS